MYKQVPFLTLFFAIILVMTSCVTTNKGSKVRQEIERDIRRIEQAAREGDVEELLENLDRALENHNMRIEDFKDSAGKMLGDGWRSEMARKGFKKELEREAKYLIENFLLLDEEAIAEYTKKVIYYAEKIGFNLLDTLKLIVDYSKKLEVKFDEKKFMKALTKIWKDK